MIQQLSRFACAATWGPVRIGKADMSTFFTDVYSVDGSHSYRHEEGLYLTPRCRKGGHASAMA